VNLLEQIIKVAPSRECVPIIVRAAR
jgi:hypothetical protein